MGQAFVGMDVAVRGFNGRRIGLGAQKDAIISRTPLGPELALPALEICAVAARSISHRPFRPAFVRLPLWPRSRLSEGICFRAGNSPVQLCSLASCATAQCYYG